MITQAILSFLHGAASLLVNGLSAMLPDPPGFWTDVNTYIDTLSGGVVAPLRYFLPIGPSIIIAGALLVLMMVAGALKLARMVFSVFTLGGGGVG